MTSASIRTILLFVVHRAKAFLRRFARTLGTFVSDLCAVVIRTAITAIVFSCCLLMTLHYFGVPVPGPAELLNKFEGLGRLVDVLS